MLKTAVFPALLLFCAVELINGDTISCEFNTPIFELVRSGDCGLLN